MNEDEYLMKNYGDRGGCYMRITPYEISIILHVIRKPNSIIVLLFIQNNSQFKNMAKTCLPPSIHRCYVHLRQCTFRVVQLRKYSANSRCRPSSCILAVLAMFLAIISPKFLLLKRVKCPPYLFPQPTQQLNLVPRSSRLTAAFLTSFPR